MSSSLVQALLAFLLIVIAIPVALVTLRRVRMFNPASRQVMRLAGGIALGPRERIAVVEVGGRWLVVGVTGQSINLLTTLDSAPADLAASRSPLSATSSSAASSSAASLTVASSPVPSLTAEPRDAEPVTTGPMAPPATVTKARQPGEAGGGSPFARLLATARRREAH